MSTSRATPIVESGAPRVEEAGPDFRARAKRIVVRVAIVLASIYGGYLLVANLLLATPFLRYFINRDPLAVLVEYSSASTWWFGRVHVRNFKLRARDTTAEFMVTLDDGIVSIDLLALSAKTFRATKVRGNGVSVRARLRVDPKVVREADLEGIPPIEGYPDVPFEPPAPPFPPATDENYPYWTVDLVDVDVTSVREVWIGPFRFAGGMRVAGGFYLRPARKFAISPASAVVDSGELTFGKRIFASEVKGRLDARVDMHDPRRPYGVEELRYMHGRARFESRIVDLGFAQRWLGTDSKFRVFGGAGSAISDVSMTAGVLDAGSKVEVESKAAEVMHPELSVQTSMKAQIAIVAAAGGKPEATFSASFTDVALRRHWAESYPLTVPTLQVMARTHDLDLVVRPFEDLLVSFDMPKAELTNMQALNTFMPKTIRVGPGRATMRAHFDVSVHEALAKGSARIEVGKTSVKVDDVTVQGAATIGVSMPKLTLEPLSVDLAETFVELRDVAVETDGAKPANAPRQWWGRLELFAPTIRLDRKLPLVAGLRVKLRDARPIMYVFAAKDTLPSWTRELLSLDGLTGTARLQLGPDAISVDAFDAKGGSFALAGRYEKRPSHESGRITIGTGVLAVGVEVEDGNTSIVPKVAPNWSKERAKSVAPK